MRHRPFLFQSCLSSAYRAPEHFHTHGLFCAPLRRRKPGREKARCRGLHGRAGHTRAAMPAPPGGGQAGPWPCGPRALTQARPPSPRHADCPSQVNFPPRPGKAAEAGSSAPIPPALGWPPAPEYLPPVPPLRCSGSASSRPGSDAPKAAAGSALPAFLGLRLRRARPAALTIFCLI